MNLAAVMDEIGAVLESLEGLRVTAWPAGSINPPGGVLSYPESIDYDVTYRRALDKISDLPVFLVTGRATERSARDAVAAWSAGSGSRSVKQLLEAHTWASCGEVAVTKARFDTVAFGGADYLAVIFSLDITGPGATS